MGKMSQKFFIYSNFFRFTSTKMSEYLLEPKMSEKRFKNMRKVIRCLKLWTDSFSDIFGPWLNNCLTFFYIQHRNVLEFLNVSSINTLVWSNRRICKTIFRTVNYIILLGLIFDHSKFNSGRTSSLRSSDQNILHS